MVATLDMIGDRIDRLKCIRDFSKSHTRGGRPEGMTRLPTRDATFDEEATLLAGHLLEDHLHSAAAEVAKPLLLPKWLPVPDSAVLLLLSIVVWCWVSWSIAQLGMYHLAALTLVSLIACVRIHSLTYSQDELDRFKDENTKFKQYNADLKNGVELLTAKNEQFKCSNQELKESIAGLEHIRKAMQDHASKHNIDISEILKELRQGIFEQKDLMEKSKANEMRTRKLTEMQVRAMLLNLYSMCEYPGKRGLSKIQFNKFCTMLPVSVSDKLSSELSFELVDIDGDGVIDIKNLSDWMHNTMSKVFDADDNQILDEGGHSGGGSSSSTSYARTGGHNKAQRITPRRPFTRHTAGCQGANRRARSSPALPCRRALGDPGLYPRDSPQSPSRLPSSDATQKSAGINNWPRNLPLVPARRSAMNSPGRTRLPLPSIPSTDEFTDDATASASGRPCVISQDQSIATSALKHLGSEKNQSAVWALSAQKSSPSRQDSLGSCSTAVSMGIYSPNSTPTASDAEGPMHEVVRSHMVASGLLVRI